MESSCSSPVSSAKKIGRAFFRRLSERQYSKDMSSDRMELNEALKCSLLYWRGLIEYGPRTRSR